VVLEIVHGSEEQLRVAEGPFEGIMVACQNKKRVLEYAMGVRVRYR
jgi:hypothetical protein